jgi:hypothetical protein
MKPSALIESLECALDSCVPAFVWGESGIGKSDIIRQVAYKRKVQFTDLRAVLLDPVDLRGLPSIKDDVTRWVPPEFLPREGSGILFLDELPSAPQMTQAACYQLVLDRRLGEYRLPDDWRVVAAGNPPKERGVHFAMPRPLLNRFWHLTLEPDLDEWCVWAINNGVLPEMVAYLRFKRELFHAPDLSAGVNAWPTPRSNVMASKILADWAKKHRSDLKPLLQQMLMGVIGEGAAGELYAFLQLFRNLPSTTEILSSPKTARLPGDVSASIAIATALGRVINTGNFAQAVTYLDRMEDEFHVLAVTDATRRNPDLCSTPEYTKFGVRFQDLVA